MTLQSAAILLALIAFVILAVLAAVGGGHLWVVLAVGLALFAAGHLSV